MTDVIVITGCPRSGTLLTARILGSCRDVFLITEHSNKQRDCPEDRSGANDEKLWRETLSWSDPREAVPAHSATELSLLRETYLSLARNKRLVIKNPSHIVRLPILREMFPSARFVFVSRPPWPTIASMVAGNKRSFIIPTQRVMALPDDLLLRASTVWAEAHEIYMQSRDEIHWTCLSYDELNANPRATIAHLFGELGLSNTEDMERASALPQARNSGKSMEAFFQRLSASRHQARIIDTITPAALVMGYSVNVNAS